eukprot:m.14155 g.14155  ORF g.14155 m.14155 type:complete len:130 (-) comp4742_c0_seq1:1817-2206(-)
MFRFGAARVAQAAQTFARCGARRTQTSVAAEAPEALVEKSKGPWNALSADERVALYRSAYPLSRKEAMNPPSDTTKVLTYIGIGIAASFVLFKAVSAGFQSVPATMTKEWEDASQEKKKKYNMNPTWSK